VKELCNVLKMVNLSEFNLRLNSSGKDNLWLSFPPFDKNLLYKKNKEIKIGRRQLRSMPSAIGPRPFRLFYVRYADDWILLTNVEVSKEIFDFLGNLRYYYRSFSNVRVFL
jgi:hypothetical protein